MKIWKKIRGKLPVVVTLCCCLAVAGLSALVKGMNCHINLIPANEVPEKGHERSSDNDIKNFKAILEKAGHTVTVRRTLGSDINASCGQLRREKMKENNL